MVGESVLKTEGGKRRLIINCKGSPYGADLAQYPQVFKEVIEKLQTADPNEIVLTEYYERIYNEEQTKMLKEIADLVSNLETDSVWSPSHIGKTTDSKKLAGRHDAVLKIMVQLKTDPFRAYLSLLSEQKAAQSVAASVSGAALEDLKVYQATIAFMRQEMEKLTLIKKMATYVSQLGSLPADRGIYHAFFEVSIKPSFIGSRIFFTGTSNLELADQYEVIGTKVYIYKHPDKIEYLYYINPPEYTLPPDKYFLLEKTKEVVAGHRPTDLGFLDVSQARSYFHKVYVATISDIAAANNITLSVEEKEELATIVSRYTVGYGIMEILLSDRQLTDVYVDSPLGVKPIYVVHSKYGQCQSNVIFSDEEARSIVSRFRALSGRPFDEAHPILDFDIEELQTRIAVIGKPLALDGIAFAYRLHKDTPWTLAQFLDQKMFSPLGAGMLSYFVDAQASMLIVGSRGAGKTSMLQAMMQEIPQNLRIIVQEDSVTGDSRILALRNGILEHTTVGKLIDGLMESYGSIQTPRGDLLMANPEEVKLFSLDSNNKISLQAVSQFIRHKVSKPIFEVTTRTGKSIKVTGDHSLFTLGNFGVNPIKANELKEGSYLALPRRLPANVRGLKEFNVLKPLVLPDSAYLHCPEFKQKLSQIKKELASEAAKSGFSRSISGHWVRSGVLPVKIARKFPQLLDSDNIRFKLDRKSKPIPCVLNITPEFLEFAGMWLADGCYDGKFGAIISAGEPEEVQVIDAFASQMGLSSRVCTDEYSRILSNTGLVWLLREVVGLSGNSFTKHFPAWAYSLPEQQLASVLRGFYSGDGYAGKYEVTTSLRSKKLIDGLKTLLLRFGVVSREQAKSKQGLHILSISSVPMLANFARIGFLQGRKNQALLNAVQRVSSHDAADVIPLPRSLLESIASASTGFNRQDYLTRGNSLGRRKLGSVAQGLQESKLQKLLYSLSSSDIYWDEVVSVKQVSSNSTYVYDFSVPSCENFVCENIIAHNTQELPVPALKREGFSIQRLKTRPPLGNQSDSEVSAEDALRTALRLGDSVLIVGEVRSTEARALYEAMRVGAVGNVVMGTIHGESAYSIWDRVVNDLGVPTTSFKATDFAVVAAPIRFGGSLKRHRRLIEVTEIKKHWEHDPAAEGGLLPWLEFDGEKDEQKFYENHLDESEWIQRVSRMRGITKSDILDEIKTRGESKWHLVELKRKYDLPQIIEANYTIRAHNKYMILAEQQREQFGSVDRKGLLEDWKSWVSETLLREALAAKNAMPKN